MSQVEILLSGLWDPSSGNLFAEEGDQQRFWKITRKFVEQMAAVSGSKVKAVGSSMQQSSHAEGIPMMCSRTLARSTRAVGHNDDKLLKHMYHVTHMWLSETQ